MKTIQINKYQIGVFAVNMLLIFLMVMLGHMHLSPPLFSSNTNSKTNIFDSILPKLELKENNFHLKKESFLVPAVSASGDFDRAPAYIVINYDTGEILAEKNSQEPRAVASLAKIMTSIVALDLAAPGERFVVTENAAKEVPTRIGVVASQSLTLEELLNASLMTSANDAAEVIRDGLNSKYSEDGLIEDIFVSSMNAKAKFLNLKNTHFTNPQGFDNENPYSSASDMAVLSHYALDNYPLIDEIVKKDYQFLTEDKYHKQFDLYNWNGLLGVYPGVFGIKIGNTRQAGVTTIVVSEREGKKVLVVLLGTPGVLERDLWASQLLDIGFEKLDLLPVNITPAQLKNKYSTWKYWN